MSDNNNNSFSVRPPKKLVEEWLKDVKYGNDLGYVPSRFALEFVNFIKLVNGGKGEENLTPVLHYKMLDQICGKRQNIANMIHRGAAKTTVFGEYLILYIATYGGIPDFGDIPLGLYVSDSIDNGVKNMRKNLEYRWSNSEFLMKYVPKAKFTDIRWEFTNIDGNTTVFKGYGAQTGVRGSKEMGKRPYIAILDDLVSDEDARSATVIASIEDTVYKAIDYALHPTRRKTIWSGTPFNAKDPLYKAVESGAWWVNVYPVCEEFPCSREDFRGSWEDRFDYDYVMTQYQKALAAGKIDTFMQEMMLRIMSNEDRLVADGDIIWYKRADVLKHKSRYNFYITTDLATSEKASADFSVISVWAYNNNGDWLWVDGVCKRQLTDKSIDDIFRLAQMYKPQGVGIEVTGQQSGFIPWIQGEMVRRNIFFNLTSENNNGNPGLRPNTNKMQRFNVILPMFKLKKIWFPEGMENDPCIAEAMNELRNASASGFKSKHDDFIDTISMLSSMNPWKPSEEIEYESKDGVFQEIEFEEERKNSLVF